LIIAAARSEVNDLPPRDRTTYYLNFASPEQDPGYKSLYAYAVSGKINIVLINQSGGVW